MTGRLAVNSGLKYAVRISLCATAIVVVISRSAPAHEGETALPTRGVVVRGDSLLLSDESRKALGVTVAPVKLRDLCRSISADAVIEVPPRQSAQVTSLVAGRVERLLVQRGEMVAAGQELLRLESLDLESLQAELLQTAAALELSQRMIDLREQLAEDSRIPGKLLLESRAEWQQHRSQLQIAFRKLRALGVPADVLEQVLASRQRIASLSLDSPIAGIITELPIVTGQSVETSTVLCRIADCSKLWAVGGVLESDVQGLRPGLTVRLTSAGEAPDVCSGIVEAVGMKLNPARQTLGVWVAIDHPCGKLEPGAFVRMHIDLRCAAEAIACPADALIEDGHGGRGVLLEELSGRFVRREVQLGLRDKESVEILDGLFPGDQVVINGKQALAACFGPAEMTPRNASSSMEKTAAKISPAKRVDAAPTTIRASGRIVLPPQSKAFASPAAEGRVACVLVERGELVAAGQVLAEIDSLAIRRLMLELLHNHSRLGSIRQSLVRLRQLDADHLVQQQELWRVETDESSLAQAVSAISRKLELAGLSPDEITLLSDLSSDAPESPGDLPATLAIRAPLSGRIADVNLVLGQVVAQADRLFEIHDAAQVWVEALVFGPDANLLEPGQAARIRLVSTPGAELSGAVFRIGTAAADPLRLVPVWIALENATGELKEGMTARVVFKVD